jgi:hypothetical protein
MSRRWIWPSLYFNSNASNRRFTPKTNSSKTGSVGGGTMTIDERILEQTRTQFGSQVGHLTPTQISQVRACLQGTETLDFGEGLLAGLAAAHQILSLPDGVKMLKLVIAVVAHDLSRKHEYADYLLDTRRTFYHLRN